MSEKKEIKADVESIVNEYEKAESFKLDNLEVGKNLEVKTRHTTYLIEHREDGFYISGNLKYCPEPTKFYLNGSTFGGSLIKIGEIVVGGRMEFFLTDKASPIITSRILSSERLIKSHAPLGLRN